eukprot:2612865-Amphidinium_carterae.1
MAKCKSAGRSDLLGMTFDFEAPVVSRRAGGFLGSGHAKANLRPGLPTRSKQTPVRQDEKH